MEKEKSLMADLLADLKMSRRRFLKASAVTGTAVAAGAGLKPELKALAAAQGTGGNGMGKWKAAT